jgi:hypothetical protein
VVSFSILYTPFLPCRIYQKQKATAFAEASPTTAKKSLNFNYATMDNHNLAGVRSVIQFLHQYKICKASPGRRSTKRQQTYIIEHPKQKHCH